MNYIDYLRKKFTEIYNKTAVTLSENEYNYNPEYGKLLENSLEMIYDKLNNIEKYLNENI
jgi:hypothetical protein